MVDVHDEVETGVHVSALGRVFEWLVASARRLGVQVFVTTHSLEALDALISAPSIRPGEDVVVFDLTQLEGATQCKRFAGDLLHPNALFQLLEQRYARKRTLITTNLEFDQWYDLFRNKPLVDALLDRLQHHCITLRLTGPSLRAPMAQADPPASR